MANINYRDMCEDALVTAYIAKYRQLKSWFQASLPSRPICLNIRSALIGENLILDHALALQAEIDRER